MDEEKDTVSNELNSNEQEVQEESGSILIEILVPNLEGAIQIPAFSTAETLFSVKQILQDFYETAHFTCYILEMHSLIDSNGIVEVPTQTLDEMREIKEYVLPTTVCCRLKMVPEPYNLKRIKQQVKKTRDLVLHPPTARGITGKTNTPKASSQATIEMPTEEVQQQSIALQYYFKETLLRVGSVDRMTVENANILLEHVKYLSASGWNPPPKHRQLQGDLFYVEVVTQAEGSLYITANRK
jgi:hypothetical protein